MPKIRLKKILIFYKTSVYRHCLSKKKSVKSISTDSEHLMRLKETHNNHYESLQVVETALKKKGVHYKKAKRGQYIDFANYNFIISIGGDGTLLEAARHMKNQLLLGVNSDPKWSIGRLCSTSSKDFSKDLDSILRGQFRIQILNRLQLKIKGCPDSINILNDILICHKNPAAMSRYRITCKGKSEEQKSSGVWISTAAGSTGAIHSADAKSLPLGSKKYAYKARELYTNKKTKYRFRGGALTPPETIKFTSLMKDGIIYADGCHKKIPFPIGKKATLSLSHEPLRVIKIK